MEAEGTRLATNYYESMTSFLMVRTLDLIYVNRSDNV